MFSQKFYASFSIPLPQDQIDGRPLNIVSKLTREMAASPEGSAATSPVSATNVAYRPVYKHWFYKKTTDAKAVWSPFSMTDSMSLEEAFVAKCKCHLGCAAEKTSVN